MTKNEIQTLAAQILAKHKRLVLQWATGTGKSRAAINFINANPDFHCLILVPEDNNIKNWLDEFSECGVCASNVEIICYASFHKYKDTDWDLIVYDECPHFDTEKKKAISRSIKVEYVLALGAIVDDEEMKALEDAYGEFQVWSISLDKAIKWNLLPTPTVWILHMQMDDTNICPYKNKKLSDKGVYDFLMKQIEAAKSAFLETPIKINQLRMLRAGNERKRFLGALKDKAARKICDKLREKNKRFICFCSSINQANYLGGANAFTSKTPKSMKILDKFNNHEIDSLFVVGKCIEGQNLRDIDCGVIVQLGGTSRITVQACGRIMRSEKPVIYIPVFDDTKDNSFLYTVTSNISKDYIKHYKF